MKDACPSGGSKRLEVAIAEKNWRTADGDTLRAITDCALSLGRGEVGALVGPSGCGKTTLLRIVAGLDADYRGHVTLPDHGRLGVVFQDPRLLPWRSVDDNVRIAAPEADAATLDALFGILGLAAHRRHFPGQLSLGLARRAALARALAVAPDLLLLDEPFVSLDAALALALRNEIAALVESRRVTTLIVTHDLDEAIHLADRIFLLTSRPMRVRAVLDIAAPRGRMTPDLAAKLRAAALSPSGEA